MEWIKNSDGDYEAKGEKGRFLIWKNGSKWYVNYSAFKGYHNFSFKCGTLKDAKAACERNFYWEKKAQ